MLQFSSLINWRNLQGEINHSLLVNSQQSSLTIFFGEIDEILFLLAISCSPGSSGCINRAEIVTETRNFSESLKGFCWDPCSFLSPRFEFHASGKIGHFRELDAFFLGVRRLKTLQYTLRKKHGTPTFGLGDCFPSEYGQFWGSMLNLRGVLHRNMLNIEESKGKI
jgi:hypothetical protein